MPLPFAAYLVGGAVRNRYLGLPVQDRDWVVVGSSPEEMIHLGFKPVGGSFPVFLHPLTHEEYALARTERKVGRGYHGFEFISHPSISLEEDLSRRDLTINALALDQHGRLIDPFCGLDDLNNRILRHVSEAFSDDPLRVLRVGRLAAQLADFGFSVHPDTLELMKYCVAQGEIRALTEERIWLELHKALSTKAPRRFIEILRACGALVDILPEVDQLFGVPKNNAPYPIADAGHYLLQAIDYVAEQQNPFLTFSVLLHHVAIDSIKSLCSRLKVPKQFARLARLTALYYLTVDKVFSLQPEEILAVFLGADALRKQDDFTLFLKACEACLGRVELQTGLLDQQRHFFEQVLVEIKNLDVTPWLVLPPAALAEEIRKGRLLAISRIQERWLKKPIQSQSQQRL